MCRKTRILSVFCLLGLFGPGCVPSLHPLYTPSTQVYDPAFVGRWQQDDACWEFVGDAAAASYVLTVTDEKGKPSKLEARLVAVDGHRFFDFYPAEDARLDAGDFLKLHLLAVHLFFKVEQTADGFSLAAMNPETLENLLAAAPDRIRHERVDDDRVVLTDSPERLQRLLLDGLTVDGFFGDPMTLTPLRDAAAETD